MGSPTLYYYPDPAGTLESITLPGVSDLPDLPHLATVARSRSVGGVGYVRVFSTRRQVQIIVDGITDAATIRSLLSLQVHLDRGGLVGFALDAAKGWSGYVRTLPERGDSTLYVAPMARYSSSATLAASDEVWIESASPERNAELSTVSTFSESAITLGTALRYPYSERPIVVRHRDYHPALAAPESGRALMLSERRLAYRLDLLLAEEPVALRAMVEQAELQGTSRGRFFTLPQAEEEIRRRARTSFTRPGRG